MKITIIYPVEPSYIFGLVEGLSKTNISVELIGSDRMRQIQDKYNNISVINLRGSQDTNVGLVSKSIRITKFYLSLINYFIRTESKLVHIHWPNRFFFFDSTILILVYKLLGKKIVYTAHNIDQGMRDKKAGDRRMVYKFLYKMADHIIVHNQFSKRVLKERFNVSDKKISIRKMGIIKAPTAGISQSKAREDLKLPVNKKIILFFGGINEYKGLDLLVESFKTISEKTDDYLLLIAGQPREKEYFNSILPKIDKLVSANKCIGNFGFIPYEDVEKYFLAADCIVLAYKYIFQSAVFALSFSFGLPIIASDVGSFKEEDIIEGMNGYICKPNDINDLSNTILKYFNSDLYKNLKINRSKIIAWAEENYSWDKIADETIDIYKKVLSEN